MKVEMMRSRMGEDGQTLEAGRVYEVESRFALWLMNRGAARPYNPPKTAESPVHVMTTDAAAAIVRGSKIRKGE